MNEKFVVEMPDGSYITKLEADLKSDDLIVFDSPESFDGIAAAKARLDAEIEAAGGLLAWQDSAE